MLGRMGRGIPDRHHLIERHMASLILETTTSLVQCSELSAKMWMPASGGTLYVKKPWKGIRQIIRR